jgi:hypothetical protein
VRADAQRGADESEGVRAMTEHGTITILGIVVGLALAPIAIDLTSRLSEWLFTKIATRFLQ